MKSTRMFFIVFIFVLFFIPSCAKNEQNKNINENLEFKKMCQTAGYEWMLMKPTKDGKFIKDAEECFGCMVEGIEHICDKEKFMDYLPQK